METSKRIIIDADACPRSVKAIAIELSGKHKWELITVASFKHHFSEENNHITVGDEPQAVDMAILNMSKKGDIIITQDWGLAAMVLGKGAAALSPHGTIYREEKIDFLLEERHMKAKVRKMGGRTKGPAARTREDDERFARSLEKLIK